MSDTELELKFVVNGSALSLWTQDLQTRLHKNGFQVVSTQSQTLENTYYDTAEQLFEQHKMGMRVRGRDGSFEQTIKTQKAVTGGLHERNEFNVALPDAQPDVSRFDQAVWKSTEVTAPDNADLIPQFSTQFSRLSVHLTHASGDYELVFDEGTINTENASTALNELEIELIEGDANAVLLLASLLSLNGIRLSDVSKAAQGYELLQGLPNKVKALPMHLSLNEGMSTEDVFCRGCEMAMAHWQYHEHRFYALDSAKMLAEVQVSMRLLLQTLSLFLPVLQCQPLLDLQRKVLSFSDSWLWVDELQSTRFLLSKKGPLHKTLGRQGAVISYLQGRQAGLMNTHEPDQLLYRKAANDIKLAVVNVLLTKPWGVNANGAKQPIIEHAKGWLSQGRQTLHQSLQSTRALPASNYIAIETMLRQTLFNGFLLSDLFAHSAPVRAPWLDLLIGIDEIRALALLKHALLEAELEFEEGLVEWVDEKMGHLLEVMERTRQVALSKDVYW